MVAPASADGAEPADRLARAYAKINLSLEITGKRRDGYHDLVSVFQAVSLADSLRVRPATGVWLRCSDAGLDGDDNLVLRAAHLLRQRFRVAAGADMELIKRIPAAAGLGGGSSDAASALMMLVELWNLSLSTQELEEAALQLGSDVPFFLHGGTALVEGRGERVQHLTAPRESWFVLVKPALPVSTSAVFAALPPSEWTDGCRTREVARAMQESRVPEFGMNGLQETTFRLYPEVRDCFERVAARAPAIMTGSGPTVVALCASQEEAEVLESALVRWRYWMAVAHSVNTGRAE